MKKICTNKSDIYAIYGCIFFIISIVGLLITLSILAEDNDYGKNALISLSIFIIVSIILTILCSELHLKKYGKYIEINDKCLVYNEKINIPIFLIKKIEYKKEKLKLDSNKATFKILSNAYCYQLFLQTEKDMILLSQADTRYLSSEVAGGFTGVYLGFYAVDSNSSAVATFTNLSVIHKEK